MNKVNSKISTLLILVICLSFSNLKSQSYQNQNSLILIQKIKSFPICKPFPQYIVEIKNDKSISFYNHLPENFTQHQSELLENWIIDSTTIILDSSDFFDLEKIILGIDLQNLEINLKNKSDTGNVACIVGGSFDNYTIQTSNQTIEFGIGPNNEENLSNSVKTIRNTFEAIELKYKPVR